MNEKYRPVRDIQPPPDTGGRVVQAGPKSARVLIALLSAVVLIVSGLGYATVGRLGSEVASAGNLSLGGNGDEGADGAVDILLVGSDSRSDAQGNTLSEEEAAMLNAGDDDGAENTDTLMLIRVPNDGSSATAVSIPRDTYVSDEELGNVKINGVYGTHKWLEEDRLAQEGELSEQQMEERAKDVGREKLIDVVGDLTGVEVDHYAEVGLLGFVLLTDAVGGVEVCLNEPVDEPMSGAQFEAGVQTVGGADALAFVRQRHGLPRGDLDRIVRQQAFMASLVNKVLNAGTLTNPARLSNMGQAVERSVVLDEDWDVMSFALQLQNLAGGNVLFTTIPVTSIDGVGDYGESIVTVDLPEVHDFMEDLLGDGEEAEPAEDEAPEAPAAAEVDAEDYENAAETEPEIPAVNVHVLNGSFTAGLAGGVGGHLDEAGWSLSEVANAQPGIYAYSQVVAADPQSPAAQQLAEELGGLPVTANASLDADTLIVVAHDDYLGPQSDTPAEVTSETPVGQPGSGAGTEPAPEIDAGGDGPQCVN